MTTPRQQLAQIKREQDTARRKAQVLALSALRTKIKVARGERREREKAIKKGAREALVNVQRRMRDLRRSIADAAKAAREISRFVVPGARVHLTASKQAALASLARSHGALVHELSEEARQAQQDAAELRRAEGRAAKQRPRMSAAEKRAESDDEVRGNIPAELVPVFDARASKTKATERMSRTEAFLQWVHDHAGDAERILQTAAENIDDLIAEEKQLARDMKRRR